MVKNIYFLLFVLCVGGNFMGCSGDWEAPKLKVAVRNGLEAEGIRHIARAWTDSTAVEVEVIALPREDYLNKVMMDLESKKPVYDVIFFPGTHVPEMARLGLIEPFEGFEPKDDPDLLGVEKYQDKVYALPCDVSVFFTFYRSDLMQSAPETWDEAIAISTKLDSERAVRTPWAFSGKVGEELPKMFYPILWSHGGAVLSIDCDTVLIASRESVDAARTFMKMASTSGVPEDLDTWDVLKIYDELGAGRIGFSTPQWNALWPLLMNQGTDKVKLLKIAQIPGVLRDDGSVKVVNFRHTWNLVVPARSKTKEQAQHFVIFATGKVGGRVYAKSARGNPARKSLLTDEELIGIRDEFETLYQCLLSSQAEPYVAYYDEMHIIMNQVLSQMIAGKISPEEAMVTADSLLKTLVDGK